MSDPYASIQTDTQVQERLAIVLELRAADAQQRAMLDCYLTDFNLQNEARVLDIGCGTGAIARVLARRPGIASVVGIDLGEVLLERARKLSSGISNLSFERGHGRSLRYADGYFDAVIMHTLLSHVPSPTVVWLRRSACCDQEVW